MFPPTRSVVSLTGNAETTNIASFDVCNSSGFEMINCRRLYYYKWRRISVFHDDVCSLNFWR